MDTLLILSCLNFYLNVDFASLMVPMMLKDFWERGQIKTLLYVELDSSDCDDHYDNVLKYLPIAELHHAPFQIKGLFHIILLYTTF